MATGQIAPARLRWKTSLGLASGISLLALALPAAAAAQDMADEPTAAQDEAQIGNIVVTATKRDQTLTEAPISIGIVDDRLIKGSGATNLSEMADLMPSVVFSQQQSPTQSNVGIRGVTTAGGSAALEPSVGIYIDGVFTDRTAIGIADFNDIERVEVLRGPQSTLFGNSSPAGVINFVTKAPEFEFGGSVDGTIGNFNRRQFAGSITGPIVEDKLAFRVSAFSNDRDGFLTNLVGEDRNDQDSWGVRGKLLITPSDRGRIQLTYERGESDLACCSPVTDNLSQATLDRFAAASTEFPFVGTGVPFPANQLEGQLVSIDGNQRFRSKTEVFQLDVEVDLGAVTMTSITSYRTFFSRDSVDIDFSPLNLFRFENITRDQSNLSTELRFASNGSGPFSYLFGGYFFEKDVVEDSGNGLIVNPTVAGIFGNFVAATSPSGSDITNRNYALFGEATYEFTDRLSLTGGLRYNYDEKEITAFAARLRLNGTELSPTQTIPEEFQQRSGGQLTGRAVIQYEFNDRMNTYASYTRGYKAFGINDDANLLRNVPGASFFFDSEKVDNYEIGFKAAFPESRAVVSVVLFNTKYNDFQSLSSFTDENDNLRFFLQNAASLTSRGVEFDGQVEPFDGLVLNASATYLDATFDSFPDAEGPTGPLDLSGARLFDAPKFSASLASQYTTAIGSDYEAFLRADVFYRSKVFTDQNLDPLEVQDGFARINARIGFGRADGLWRLEFWGRNLTDEITFGRAGAPLFGALNALLPFAGIPPFPTGDSRIKFVGEPRTYGLTLRSSF
jgi:iron complex outermembrane receptor protein